MTTLPDVSIVVPVFKAQYSLPTLHSRIANTLGNDLHWELVLVDDASPDGTRQIAEHIVKQDSRVSYCRLESNHGQHYATIYGLKRALGAKVVTMDDDLEHAPEDIPKLIAPLSLGFLVVIASLQHKTHPWLRCAGSWFMGCVWNQFYGAKGLAISSFKAFNRPALEILLARKNIMIAPFSAHILETLPRSSLTNVAVDHQLRSHGKSNYSLSMLLRECIRIVKGGLTRVLPRIKQ